LSDDSEADYDVGYRRPPVNGRWKPGQSGNPRGRRKGSKTVGKIIEEALMRKVTIEDVTLTLQEVIIRNLVNAAARRDMKAIQTLFALRERYQDSTATVLNPAELEPNDQAIIKAYFENLQITSRAYGNGAQGEKGSAPGDLATDNNPMTGRRSDSKDGVSE
jgi:hypothetical protein